MCASYTKKKAEATKILKPILNGLNGLGSMRVEELRTSISLQINSTDYRKIHGQIEQAVAKFVALQV